METFSITGKWKFMQVRKESFIMLECTRFLGFVCNFPWKGRKRVEKKWNTWGERQEIEEGSVDSEEATGYRKCKIICRNAICRQIMTN